MYKGFLNGYQSPASVTSSFTAKINALYKTDGVELTNSLKIGDSLDINGLLSKDGQQLLNGIENTTISDASLKAIFNDLQEGIKMIKPAISIIMNSGLMVTTLQRS